MADSDVQGFTHSNGVSHVNSNGTIDPLSNGQEEIEEEEEREEEQLQNEEHLKYKRKQPRKLSAYERDIISVIGQHLRERGYE